MNSKITRAGILFAFGILMVGHATPEDTSKLPPSSLQLLLARVPGQVADLKLVDIEDLLRNHKREIFSEDYDKKKFYLLGDLCESLEKNPQGKDLLPLLLKEITSQKAVDCPPVGWDEIMVSGKGGGIGLLMKCVLAISGEAGFNQIFDSVVSAENPVKLNILLIQVNIRGVAGEIRSGFENEAADPPVRATEGSHRCPLEGRRYQEMNHFALAPKVSAALWERMLE